MGGWSSVGQMILVWYSVIQNPVNIRIFARNSQNRTILSLKCLRGSTNVSDRVMWHSKQGKRNPSLRTSTHHPGLEELPSGIDDLFRWQDFTLEDREHLVAYIGTVCPVHVPYKSSRSAPKIFKDLVTDVRIILVVSGDLLLTPNSLVCKVSMGH